MSFWEQFPYTNFHELNLSWLLNKMKAVSGSVESVAKKVDEIPSIVRSETERQLSEKNIDEIVQEYVSRATTYPCRNIRRNYRIIRRNDHSLRGVDTGFYAQGFCTSNDAHFYGFINPTTNQCTIVKTSDSGTIISSVDVGDSHANDMTEYNGRLLVLNLKNVDNVAVNTIKVMSAETLSTIKTLDCSEVPNAYGISYDKTNGKLYLFTSATVFEVVENGDAVDVVNEYPIASPINATYQSATIRGGLAIVETVLPDGLHFLDIESGNYIEHYHVDSFIEDVHPHGELEGVDFYNGNILFTGCMSVGTKCEHHITQCFELQFSSPFTSNKTRVNHGGGYLYLDVNPTLGATNPDGVSVPFALIGEAALIARSPYAQQFTACRIRCSGLGYVGSVDFSNTKNITMSCEDGCEIGNMYAISATNLEITNGFVGVGSDIATANIELYNSDIRIGTVGLIRKSLDTLINVNGGSVNVRNITTNSNYFELYDPAAQDKTLWKLNGSSIFAVSSGILRGVKLGNVRSAILGAPILVSQGVGANYTDFSRAGNEGMETIGALLNTHYDVTINGVRETVVGPANFVTLVRSNISGDGIYITEALINPSDTETAVTLSGKKISVTGDNVTITNFEPTVTIHKIYMQ